MGEETRRANEQERSVVADYTESLYQRARKLLASKRMTRRALALAIPCGYDTLYYDIISRLIHEDPELYKQVDVETDREMILKMALDQLQKSGRYDANAIANETFYAPRWIEKKLQNSHIVSEYKNAGFYEAIEARDYEEHCGGTPERDEEWLLYIRERGAMGFEFTGEYWKRYRAIFEAKRNRRDTRDVIESFNER